MQRCLGPLSNRPRGAPPGMNPDRMFLIAKGLGLVRRWGPMEASVRSAPAAVFLGRAKSTATIICVAPKKLTKN
jgi:hypothetical protein